VRRDKPSLLDVTLWTPPDGRRSSVLIVGTRRGDVFVPTELLICAETLGDEDAIRAWLVQHDVNLTAPCRNTAPCHPEPRTDRQGP
jgi:hypothetical protein